MNQFIQSLRNLGPVRLAVIGGVGVAVLAFVVYLLMRLGGPEMALLYADLNPADASKITARLDQLNVPYRLRGDGTEILVPVDAVPKTRITLAGEGLPAGGSLGYEIFDKSQGLATSSFVQNINQVRALEGELARTLTGIENVRGARVHLVLPQRELFSRERQAPSASIMLRMAGAKRLEKPQVVAIQHIVAAAVPGLKPERISIVDEHGTLLARGSDPNSPGVMLQTAEEMRIAYESRVARAVEALLERSLGYGKVRAEVNADIDYSRTTENQEIFNPDQQVLRSTQTVNENAEQSESDTNPSVTVANNLPAGQAQQVAPL
ncbi:MAG: flagellar M-ring protein FliF, partial [Alphaproteobacteria bacterium]|nr:flagellar M-ring protein FliF [Alphaproteobacteria bacterium]